MTLTFDDIVGSEDAKEKVKLLFSPAVKDRTAQIADLIIFGPPGNGKTTIAEAGALHVGRKYIKFNSAAIKNPFAIRSVVSEPPNEGLVICFDECHLLAPKIQDSLLNALESGKDGKRILTTAHKDVVMNDYLQQNISFCFATTDVNRMRKALMTRLHKIEIHPYSVEEHKEMAYRYFKRHYGLDRTDCDDLAVVDIAVRSRCGRDVVNNCDTIWLLMGHRKVDKLTKELVVEAFKIIGVDEFGLTRNDRKLLSFLARNSTFVGLETLEAAMEMPKADIKNNIEPYLLRQGYMLRQSSGRIITDRGKFAVSMKS